MLTTVVCFAMKPVLKNTSETELWIHFYMLFCPLRFWILLLSIDSMLFMKELLNLFGLMICVLGVALTWHRLTAHRVFSKSVRHVYSLHGEKLHGAPLCIIYIDSSPLIHILESCSSLKLFWPIVTGNGVPAGIPALETFSWWDKG